MNPLMKFAILSNNIPAVRKLLDRGELPDAVDKNGTSALMLAAQKGSAELCDMLIHAGADPLMKNKQGKTALTMAEERSHPEAAGILRRAKQTEENTSPASLEEFFSAEDWQEEERHLAELLRLLLRLAALLPGGEYELFDAEREIVKIDVHPP